MVFGRKKSRDEEDDPSHLLKQEIESLKLQSQTKDQQLKRQEQKLQKISATVSKIESKFKFILNDPDNNEIKEKYNIEIDDDTTSSPETQEDYYSDNEQEHRHDQQQRQQQEGNSKRIFSKDSFTKERILSLS